MIYNDPFSNDQAERMAFGYAAYRLPEMDPTWPPSLTMGRWLLVQKVDHFSSFISDLFLQSCTNMGSWRRRWTRSHCSCGARPVLFFFELESNASCWVTNLFPRQFLCFANFLLCNRTRNGTVAIFKPQVCVKTLLFLSRSAFRKTHDTKLLDVLTPKSVPENLLKYLHYSQLNHWIG